jgi:hypothetical protein
VFEAGEVYEFSYLWKRQAEQGEESGRKDRPVCLAVTSGQNPTALFLFPITSRKPLSGRQAIALSDVECRRANFDQPAWLVIDELNYATTDNLVDFVGLSPLGAFSTAFLAAIAGRIKALRTRGRVAFVRRT